MSPIQPDRRAMAQAFARSEAERWERARRSKTYEQWLAEQILRG